MSPTNEETPTTLLLVDDTAANLLALKALLENPGYRLLTAASGEEALAMVLHEKVDLVLLDVIMPGMDGFDVARHMKSVERTQQIPILFLTAVADDTNYIYRAYDVGAVDYIVKPLDSDMVRKKVQVFVDLVRQRDVIARQGEALLETARREYQLRLAESRVASDRRYRKLVEGIDHVIAWTANESLQLTFVSRQASGLVGFTPEQMLEPDFWTQHLHADDREKVLLLFHRALSEGSDLMCNHRFVASDGRVLWFHTAVCGESLSPGVSELHGFSVDVTDLKRAEEKAQQAKQAREDLLAVVSHDLRSPLGSIRMSAELISRALKTGDATKAAGLASLIARSTERMERLAGELLDIAQLEAGGLAIERHPVDVAKLVHECTEMFRPLSEERGLRLEAEVPAGLIAKADYDRACQIISNLLGNAIRFTSVGSVIVRADRSDNEVLFAIADSGPGIAAEHLPLIWDRYWQSKRNGGIGLGLAIAKALVEVHGGRIWVDSQLGVGTTFHFTLPLAPGDVRPDADADAQPALLEERNNLVKRESHGVALTRAQYRP
jgi:PAS domain S-box-containing protein